MRCDTDLSDHLISTVIQKKKDPSCVFSLPVLSIIYYFKPRPAVRLGNQIEIEVITFFFSCYVLLWLHLMCPRNVTNKFFYLLPVLAATEMLYKSHCDKCFVFFSQYGRPSRINCTAGWFTNARVAFDETSSRIISLCALIT